MSPQQLTVFLEYTRRFDQIAQNLPAAMREAPSEFDKEQGKLKALKSESVQQTIIRYFNLCSEEFFLHEDGLIEDPVWNLWAAHMKTFLSSPIFQEVWQRAREDYSAFHKFQSFVDESAPSVTTPARKTKAK
jgi:hypothetical protein